MERPEITCVNHYDIFPRNHGGVQAILGLCKGLSEWFDVNLVTFTAETSYASVIALSDHIKVFPIVLPEELKRLQQNVCNRFSGPQDPSPAVMMYYHKFQEIVDRVRFISMHSCVAIAEHAYTWNLIQTACSDKRLWYRAHNVEYDFKRQVMGPNWMPKDFQKLIYDVEKDCCEKAEVILTISEDDRNRLAELYHLDDVQKRKMMNIGAGFDADSVNPIFPKERIRRDLKYDATGMFISTGNKETIAAANKCLKIAEHFPRIQIIIAGGVGGAMANKPVPPNVVVKGVIPEDEKNRYLRECDFALNLVESGAGVNVKMFEWFAYGIPVISSRHGARGIDVTDGKECIISDYDEAHDEVDAVERFLRLSLDERDRLARNARNLLTDRYTWRKIAFEVAKIISEKQRMKLRKYALPLDRISFYETVDLRKPAGEPEWIRSEGTPERKTAISKVDSKTDETLRKLCNSHYSFELGEDIYGRFRFPFEAIKAGSRVVIYGGGVVGKIFLQQVARSTYCTICAICDQNPSQTHIVEVPVISVAELSGMPEAEYDYVLIAIEKRNIAMEIHQNLILAGISPKKLRWINPAKSCFMQSVRHVGKDDVTACYQNFFGRYPNESELHYWLNAFAKKSLDSFHAAFRHEVQKRKS